ncbi:hypothetical protein Plec18167_003659 [Paecilomyces lecythidis]|uniref:Nitronate monooxygenase domain-containing protein n=1 Tax=Paecilomyces lecythidis TaxID=3004212 RepID=A0ABR3XX94_9EURO
MSGAATSKLAVAVTRAGGLGQIGFLDDSRMLSAELERAQGELQDFISHEQSDHVLPIGMGMIVFGSSIPHWLPVISQYKPAVVWLSFGETDEFRQWIESIRNISPQTKVWVQLGTVNHAVETAQACHPDAIVLQGSDAGGHGHAHGASVISLIPEAADALKEHGFNDIPLIAAGGIMDGRGIAAAVMLGAVGAVMGTRFLAAEETSLPSDFRKAVLNASDGGYSTVRSRIFDEIWGPSPWPERYDGRCLRNSIYENLTKGLPIREVREQFNDMLREKQGWNLDAKDLPSVWAGTGVGMVKRTEKAGDIVKQVQLQSRTCLESGKQH